jgi:energy-coupling factor transporter ATP-binding protein EcfA2
MTIEDNIREWALARPSWQQEVLVALARGETFEPERISALADRLLQPGSTTPSRAAVDIILGGTTFKQVRLTSVCNLKGVNALAEGQTLSFAPEGLTVIYGNNGSGKSGYARLVKGMVSARHFSKVLPNVFTDGAPDPSAEVTYQVDGADASEKFPVVTPIDDLQQVHFYDEHCGDEYLAHESTITYRPSALTLFDGLIAVCDAMRKELQQRIKANEQQVLSLLVAPGTTAGAFLAQLSEKTTEAAIDEITTLPAAAKDDLGTALQEVARLESSDAAKERTRLRADAMQVKRLQEEFAGLTNAVSDERFTAIQTLKDDAAAKRQAASLAANNDFEGEPLAGVGSQTWRTLWDAARAFATTEAYHEHTFPHTGEAARCVLCQQPLDATAQDRFDRFNRYMTDTTQRDAINAERSYTTALAELRALDFATQQTTVGLAAVLTHDPDLARSVRPRLGALEERRNQAVGCFEEGRPVASPLLPTEDVNRLVTLTTSLDAKATATDVEGFRRELATASKELSELKAASALADSAEALKAEIARRKELIILNGAKQETNTKGITQKATDLTTEYATEQIVNHFIREADRLDLERVTLKGRGSQKGKVNQIPGLDGARHRDAHAQTVLSEGEQTVLGLAGFFTEAEFDESMSALVFDDPVTSLDHVRREKVALRLAELAQSRQAIAFTHDVAFVTELLKAASKKDVTVAARSIMHRGKVPGYCHDGFPWKAQDVNQRMGTILTELHKLKKDRLALDDDAYEKRVNEVAGMLSETWERTVTSEIVNRVYDRSKSQVRPEMVRMLARITPADNKDYQDGYGETSEWALRHDKSEEMNYVPPEPEELMTEYDRLKAWIKRIKGYQKKD